MLVTSTEKDYQAIIDYIGKDYTQCLYLYLNLKKYGYSNPNVSVYVDWINNEINAVFLKYFECLHCFSNTPSYTSDLFVEIIKKIQPKTFFLPYDYGRCLLDTFSICKDYDIMDVYRNYDVEIEDDGSVQKAAISDVEAIAEFMIKDSNFSKLYTYEELLQQNMQRIKDGYSRIYIIKNNTGNVISCVSTNAEVAGIAVVGNFETDIKYRGKGLGSKLIKYLYHALAVEGFEAYCFIEAPESRHIHEKMGSKIVDKIIKFYPKE